MLSLTPTTPPNYNAVAVVSDDDHGAIPEESNPVLFFDPRGPSKKLLDLPPTCWQAGAWWVLSELEDAIHDGGLHPRGFRSVSFPEAQEPEGVMQAFSPLLQ